MKPSNRETPRLIPLPLDNAWTELRQALEAHRNLVLVAEPGAGKTTRFPPALLRSGLVPDGKKILMLEPRRLAARASAGRIAEEQGWSLGNEVGYRVRFENKTSRSTRLEIVTEGLLARRLQSDPELSDIGAVILDEFHERSLHTDLAIGLLAELQSLARPDLRLIVMSATLDAEKVSSFLEDAPVVSVKGRAHPVDVHHDRAPIGLGTGPDFLDRVASVCSDLIEGRLRREGDVLVFLPGAREIRGVAERIGSIARARGFDCFELHGSLGLEEQDRAIRKIEGRSKFVLATNIAETSLTLDGVGTVVDTGLARVLRTDALGFPRLALSRISLASATQRTGRAGRQGPGLCYRLWSKIDESAFPAFEQPEIFRADLGEALLTLLSQGVRDPEAFTWFEKPDSSSLRFALATLSDLGFRDPRSGALTTDGKEALKLPLPPRPARLLLEAAKIGETTLGARLAALLTEKDPVSRGADLKRGASIESDVVLRLHLLESRNGHSVDRFAAANVARVAQALEAAAGRVTVSSLTPASRWLKGPNQDETAMRLLLASHPDRVARRRRPSEPTARLVGGKGVQLANFSAVERSELFVAIDSYEPAGSRGGTSARGDAQISIASRIEREWLEGLFGSSIAKDSKISFDPESRAVQKLTATFYRDLAIEEPHVSRPTADEALPVLLAEAEQRWDTLFAGKTGDSQLSSVFERLSFLQRELAIEVSASHEQRRAFLEEVCYGATRLSDVLAKDLTEAYLRHLPDSVRGLLREEAPESIPVPTGNRMKVHYPEERAPFIEVRIQEIFGWLKSPRLARGKVPVQLHLLGPNFRPVQVTSDLESFWKNGYTEVRKELRSRYPKHSWPEDPLTAKPEAKGARRRT